MFDVIYLVLVLYNGTVEILCHNVVICVYRIFADHYGSVRFFKCQIKDRFLLIRIVLMKIVFFLVSTKQSNFLHT